MALLTHRARCTYFDDFGHESFRAVWRFPILFLLLGIYSLLAPADFASAQLARVPNAFGGLASAPSTVNLVAVLPSTLRLSVSTIDLNVAIADPSRPSATLSVPIKSSWCLNHMAVGVELVAYFESPHSALRDRNEHSIPSSHVLGSLTGGKMGPFVETEQVGTPGASLLLFRQPISGGNTTAARSDDLHLQVDRVSDLGVPSGDYAGTLHLRLISY